ncbi:MAG: hypothetical protein R2752_12570 [Vicinamibacterales bacterium]
MDVFLIPLAASRHELYCEVETPGIEADAAAAEQGWWARQKARFQAMLAEAEEDRARRDRGEDSRKTGLARVIVARIAEAVAEQRLLWHLRGETRVRLLHPDELDGARAVQTARALMTQDFAKHRRWCVIDGLIAAITGPALFFVPGPNVISWYFFFRAVGHFYAMRGARQGLRAVSWDTEAAGALSGIREALDLDPADRRTRLDELADALGLEHLTGFVERVSPRRP